MTRPAEVQQPSAEPLARLYFDRYFEQAFGNYVAAGIDADVVEVSPSGLRLAYSEETAAWLSSVASSPRSADLQHLVRLLRDDSQPLGALAKGFVRLFAEVHHAGPGVERAEAREALELAASTFRSGAARLLALVLDVLPPLRAAAATHVAETVEAALFDAGVARTVQPLLRAACRGVDEALSARVDALADAPSTLPSRLGLSPTVSPARLAPAVQLARSLPCCAAPRAKLRRRRADRRGEPGWDRRLLHV